MAVVGVKRKEERVEQDNKSEAETATGCYFGGKGLLVGCRASQH